ncbi:hypothetical protein F0562_005151 [Nyssa sinensis]|uniref:TCP domain-containing protein n=1 Tax=Nyssa sinensis TaxID=561372 RepID=A0A5J5AKW0_9ASTE|nr:hypothetical protein F0562_005151 [Nyssa sinensis]
MHALTYRIGCYPPKGPLGSFDNLVSPSPAIYQHLHYRSSRPNLLGVRWGKRESSCMGRLDAENFNKSVQDPRRCAHSTRVQKIMKRLSEETLKATQVTEKISKASSSSTPWSRLKDPRIVRVSRAFGGKDRHSKVCTVRGLRDRRVRLSVPTAIQLYDLQDRLGLNQPSKVVDWLLNVAKHEIDELPPLQMPPGNFGQNHQSMLTSHGAGASQSNKEGVKINNCINWDDPLGLSRSIFESSDANLRDKSPEVAAESSVNEKENWNKRNEKEKQSDLEGHGTYVPSNFFLPRATHTPLPVGLLNNAMTYNSFYRWDASNFSLSHLGSHGLNTPQTEDLHNFNIVTLPSSLPSSLSLPSGP